MFRGSILAAGAAGPAELSLEPLVRRRRWSCASGDGDAPGGRGIGGVPSRSRVEPARWSLSSAVVVHTLPYAVRASQPWLEMTSNLLRQLYGWSLAAAAQEPPDMAQAFKDVVESATRLSQSLRRLYGWLVATAAEKLETDAAYACAAAASEKLNPSDADASAVVSRMEAEASAMIQHGWRSWFLHDRGVAVCVLLALALLAVAFICGGVCALTLSSRLAGRQDHGDRRRSGFASSSASARGHNACSGCHNIRLNHPLRKHITID